MADPIQECPPSGGFNADKQTLLAVLQFLKKNNLKETEELLKKEAKLSEEDVITKTSSQQTPDVAQALAEYKSEGDPSLYEDLYVNLRKFIEDSLDTHKCELAMILYPVYVHMYLELVYNEHEHQAQSFFHKFRHEQDHYYDDYLAKLSTVTKREHMDKNQLMENFRSSKFVIRMSRESYTHLKRYLQQHKHQLLLGIIQERLFIDVFDGVPRNKQQIDATAGGLAGEARREANKAKVYYGLLKEPDINIPLDDEDDTNEEQPDKPKKKKTKRDPSLFRKSKNDPNAPPNNRMPLPELRDSDKLDKIFAYKEALKRVKLGPEQQPHICFYTFLNSYEGVSSIDISEDSTLLAAGFQDAFIRVWSLTPTKLRAVKHPSELNIIDQESDDVLVRMMDERTASESKTLLGHNGPVYGTTFSPDKNFLLSASADGTVRLWSLLTWTNLVCYKGHNFPVWDVKFSPHGHYFASVGHDQTARLWSTDHYQPLRVFAGHLSDVDSVQFHPNSNYIATGSSDRTVRLWDVVKGNCVRTMTGHKGTIHCLNFSPDGRYLASAGSDKMVLLWDLANGNLIGQLKGHAGSIYSLVFSREGAVLASGGIDFTIRLWDVSRIFSEQDTEGDVNMPGTANLNGNYEIASFSTKQTPVLCLHFTRRNLLLGAGAFLPT